MKETARNDTNIDPNNTLVSKSWPIFRCLSNQRENLLVQEDFSFVLYFICLLIFIFIYSFFEPLERKKIAKVNIKTRR